MSPEVFVSTRAAAAMDDALPTLGDSFLGMEQEFPEMPTLVYDRAVFRLRCRARAAHDKKTRAR